MQLAEQLSAAGLPVFPCNMWYDAAKGKWQKAPAVPKGVSWLDASTLPTVALPWPSGVVGVPIPPGVVVIDLDEYKPDFDLAAITAAIGVLPWDAARIQKTVSGGHHYAFRAPTGWTVRMGDSIEKVAGLDTRTARTDDVQGGFICTGEGYTPLFGGCGVLAMTEAMRAHLPILPDSARNVLEKKTRTATTTTATPTDADTETVLSALARISPEGGRTGWRDMGMALKSWPEPCPKDEARFDIWVNWSQGDYTGGECPANFEFEGMQGQWDKFDAKKEGGINLGTLFHRAQEGGWTRPLSFDTSAAFGAGAVPADQYDALATRIEESGADPGAFDGLMRDIRTLNGSPIQTAALTARMVELLKAAGLHTPDVNRQLKTLTNTTAAPRVAGQYGKNDTENAARFIDSCYPDGTLILADETWYSYGGKAWSELGRFDIKSHVARAMAPSLPMAARVAGAYSMITDMVRRNDKQIGGAPAGLVLYQNGVLNLHTGDLLPHSPEYFTTNILPYNYDPTARCPQWLAFLGEIFEDDQERVELLQEWFGYMLTTSYDHHKIMLLVGVQRSGKSTIGRMLELLVGEQNYTGGSLAQLKDAAYLDLLSTKTVMFSGDTAKHVHPAIRDIVTEQLKKISGNDAVTFDRKYKSAISRVLPSRITLAANAYPRLWDDSGALASRILMLPFDVSFLGREDMGLGDRLEAEIEGIALWSLQGMARLKSVGRFTSPEASKRETDAMAEQYSPLNEFIGEVCTLGEGRTSAAEVYAAYVAWCTRHGDIALSRRQFISDLKDATRGKGCKYGKHRRGDEIIRGFDGMTIGPVEHATTTGGAFAPTVIEGGKK
jgi:P4 family phage/plasmid primase-like protien